MRLIRLKIVVLPAPLGPMMVKTSPVLHVEAHAVDGLDAAEVDRELLGREEAHRSRSDRM